MAKPLKDQAFATPDKVAELVQKVGHLLIRNLELFTLFFSLNYRISSLIGEFLPW